MPCPGKQHNTHKGATPSAGTQHVLETWHSLSVWPNLDPAYICTCISGTGVYLGEASIQGYTVAGEVIGSVYLISYLYLINT